MIYYTKHCSEFFSKWVPIKSLFILEICYTYEIWMKSDDINWSEIEKETNQTQPLTILYWTFSHFRFFFFFLFFQFTYLQSNASKINEIFGWSCFKEDFFSEMWLEWKQSRLKVIFFILLLLLIASGSVQINVATTTCKNVETLPQKNHLSCFKSLLVSIYIILWLLHKSIQ